MTTYTPTRIHFSGPYLSHKIHDAQDLTIIRRKTVSQSGSSPNAIRALQWHPKESEIYVGFSNGNVIGYTIDKDMRDHRKVCLHSRVQLANGAQSVEIHWSDTQFYRIPTIDSLSMAQYTTSHFLRQDLSLPLHMGRKFASSNDGHSVSQAPHSAGETPYMYIYQANTTNSI